MLSSPRLLVLATIAFGAIALLPRTSLSKPSSRASLVSASEACLRFVWAADGNQKCCDPQSGTLCGTPTIQGCLPSLPYGCACRDAGDQCFKPASSGLNHDLCDPSSDPNDWCQTQSTAGKCYQLLLGTCTSYYGGATFNCPFGTCACDYTGSIPMWSGYRDLCKNGSDPCTLPPGE